MRACMTCDVSEVSLLHWNFLVRSAGGVESLMIIAGGYQDSQFVGGVGRLPDAMAAEMGDDVVLGAPVHAITQHAEPVEVATPATTVTARRVIASGSACLGSRHQLRARAAR